MTTRDSRAKEFAEPGVGASGYCQAPLSSSYPRRRFFTRRASATPPWPDRRKRISSSKGTNPSSLAGKDRNSPGSRDSSGKLKLFKLKPESSKGSEAVLVISTKKFPAPAAEISLKRSRDLSGPPPLLFSIVARDVSIASCRSPAPAGVASSIARTFVPLTSAPPGRRTSLDPELDSSCRSTPLR